MIWQANVLGKAHFAHFYHRKWKYGGANGLCNLNQIGTKEKKVDVFSQIKFNRLVWIVWIHKISMDTSPVLE